MLYCYIAILASERHQITLSFDSFQQANDLAVLCMQADSSNAEAVYVRGLCLYYNDNLEKGLIHFERALSLDPDNKNAREMRVKAKNLKEKKERGKFCLPKSIDRI